MKKLNKIRKIGFAILIFTAFFNQSCDKSNQNIEPKGSKEVLEGNKNEGGLIEWTDDVLPDPCKTVCLVAGQHMNVGSVDVAIVDDGLLVTYSIAESGVYLEEVHLDIFKDIMSFKAAKKVSNGGAIPGKFAYKKSWSSNEMVTSHSVKIPQSYIDELTDGADCFFIASHAALTNGETAWGGLCEETDKGVTLDEAKQFPGNNWSVYFEFCLKECKPAIIDFTYAWEDLQNNGNDGDYNDLVIKSNITITDSQMNIRFLAVARGAKYDHTFKIKIPIDGIDEIFNNGEDKYIENGNWFITVFPSSKAVLPSYGDTNHTNTLVEDEDCKPFAEVTVNLTINSDFSYNQLKPFEPFIIVNPKSNNPYDLYIYEVSERDYWTADGKNYPNGILIPTDWKWPIERQVITGPYPDFSSITDGWNPNWANNLAYPDLVWTCD